MLIVLLDADIIIDLHKFGIWEKILEKNKILIPSIILRREVIYFIDNTGTKHTDGIPDILFRKVDMGNIYFCSDAYISCS